VKTIFFDVDTQLDFLYPAGALAVPGAKNIVKSLFELTSFAAIRRIQIISTADAHTENDPEFKTWRPHCVQGSTGQQKTSGTLLKNPLVLSSTAGALQQIRSAVNSAAQIIVEKQNVDCFTNPNLTPLLEILKADRVVVYGVVAEVCVQYAAVGLLQTGAQVELVTDAIKSLSTSDEQDFIARFQAQGGRLTTVSKATAELSNPTG
jgi:nicotinamidase/pyrazinamidase